MTKTRPLLTLASSLFIAVSAQAAQWTGIGNKDSARIEVDSSSLTPPKDGKTRVWYRESYTKPKIPDSGAFSFRRMTALTELNCTKRTAALFQRSYYAADGTELKTETVDNPDAKPVAPDSVLESVFRYTCERRNKPAVEEDPTPPPAVVATPAPTDTKKTKSGKKAKDEPPPPPPPPPHWSYAGKTGPEKWGSLGPEYALCDQGKLQSPIDIQKAILADLPPIEFAYKPVPLSIIDEGHSIRIDTESAGVIGLDGENYSLLQIHFHKPSEEKINGKTYAMSAHLVHQSAAGKLAVIAVMIEPGKEHSLIRTFWSNLPLEKHKAITRPEVRIDPGLLIPSKRNYYTFLGSLTTPPCSEGVLWLVFKNPIQASAEQLRGFGTIYKNNARPVQPVNNRVIKESREPENKAQKRRTKP